MAKTLRKQLADAQHEARQLANKIDQAEHPLRVRIAELERQLATANRELKMERVEKAMLTSRIAAITKLTDITDIIKAPLVIPVAQPNMPPPGFETWVPK